MKRIVLLFMTVMASLLMYAQETKPSVSGYEGVQANKQAVQFEIKFEQRTPAIDVYMQKTDTKVKPVYYKFNFNLLRTTNRVLLNKWLKESK
ncbi:MAG: hypothetical protein CVU48_00210 [Candidatus Cloacimonetes bacterium HGW-Cloacimonetes-1]|nr:MAG: hypothetical protein CVU48_00210 [Candidatus Cloacimonetes bacterium HGW-Cloacimonetes-1]